MRTLTDRKFERLAANAKKASVKAIEYLRSLFPPGTHGVAFIRHGQNNPSPCRVHCVRSDTGYLSVELDRHKKYSRFTIREVHYTRFQPDEEQQ
jgi:hypothetical protein